MHSPLVSIIIPVYNRSDLISETLDSIKAQTFTDWECVLVDDHSTDDSFKVLEEYSKADPRFRVYSRPNDRVKGGCACRNFGFEQSKGEFIQYFDSDDLMLQNMIKEKVELLSAGKELDFVVTKMGKFFKNGAFLAPEYSLHSNNFIQDFLTYQIFFLTPGPLFKRNFLAKFPIHFSEKLERRQEREFYSRLILSRPRFKVFDHVHCYRRMHENSIQSNYDEGDLKKHLISKFRFYDSLRSNSGGKFNQDIFKYCKPEIIMLWKKSLKNQFWGLAFSYSIMILKLKF
ncbi:glycosyltransferase family 2 protein [Algoriphagus halophilus]|uniref:Glycosyltransferase involved in cell wall bisynthesis n=1 Tax=Algoriphagus halophilus TaxID=226505 RepID=A0A1N6EEH0_9BACT|nr:glycosyltransferase family 2 protein [Algoriphagus halophilus]SIN81445.1 Glycosyltransferase involved in cell wall bisynthesis [Algoriphagus halophilus]